MTYTLPVTNNAAVELPNFQIPFLEANIDMSAEATYQFCGMAIGAASGTGLIGPAALVLPGAGAQIIGVLQNNPALAEAGEVMQSGISKILLSGTVAINDKLTVDTAGNFLVATSGQWISAIAMQAGGAGNIVTGLLANLGKA